MNYMLYLLCMLLVKKSEKKLEDNKKNTKTGEMIFAKKITSGAHQVTYDKVSTRFFGVYSSKL